MTYAGSRRILDADSHLMELPDFLTRHAEARMRDRVPTLIGGRPRDRRDPHA